MLAMYFSIDQSLSWIHTQPWTNGQAAFLRVISDQGSIDFTNVLQTAFTRADPKSAKKPQVISVFLRFWDLPEQNLFIKRWLN